MLVSVVRDATLYPGEVKWLWVEKGAVSFLVNATDVTAAGADALQRIWAHFIRHGDWTIRRGGQPLRAEYVLADLPDDRAVAIDSRGGHIYGKLSPDHFSPGFADALTHATQRCADAGWRYRPRVTTAGESSSALEPS